MELAPVRGSALGDTTEEIVIRRIRGAELPFPTLADPRTNLGFS